jgi:hypothetical protein
VIKRFKFLVIIFILSISSISSCGDFHRNIYKAIDTHTDFDSLTPEQKVCYLPQIYENHSWLPIYYACSCGNVSAFKWLLSNGAIPNQECFKSSILSDIPKSEIVSELLSHGLYTAYIVDGYTGDEKTLKKVQNRLALFSRLATERPGLFAAHFAEAQRIYEMIKRYEDEIGLRTAWNAAVVSAGASYPGAGSGVVGVTEIEE